MKQTIKKSGFVVIASLLTGLLAAQPVFQQQSLIYKISFTNLQPEEWVIETQKAVPAKVFVENGAMVIDAAKDATVWLNKKLSGNILIDCYREVVMKEGAHDRLSDMNFFWMANDPANTNLFTRKGLFKEYDSLRLYYAGIGGNTNTTTRFRKYTGDGNKKVLTEYTDTPHLLQPNHQYHIQILIRDGLTECWLDNQLYFSYRDPDPIRSGYFGFRTTKSRQVISQLKIYQLK